MGAGRFVCVALPFGLTIMSLVCLLIVMLNGITNKNLNMFEVKPQNLSISASNLANIEKAFHLSDTDSIKNSKNFTAKDLGLADDYKVYMWNYCSETGDNKNCSKAKFDWAHDSLNITAINEKARSSSGINNATLPKDITNSLKAFATVNKWTQVVYIIAFLLTVLELIVGIFGFFSRLGSCATYIVSGFATVAVIAASGLATTCSVIVVAAVNSTARSYGVKAKLNTGFLSLTWIACAFSIGAGLFWAFSMCCCKAEHHKKPAGEKFRAGQNSAYTPLHDPNMAYQGQGQQSQGVYNMQHQKPMHGAGYEPYSHAAV